MKTSRESKKKLQPLILKGRKVRNAYGGENALTQEETRGGVKFAANIQREVSYFKNQTIMLPRLFTYNYVSPQWIRGNSAERD